MREDVAELSPWSANSARVKRNPGDRCKGFESFKFLACGPNVSISMNRAHSDTHGGMYQAIEPRDAIPGPGFEFPLSGTVSIEEYSPVVFSPCGDDESRDTGNRDSSAIKNSADASNVGDKGSAVPWRGTINADD
jgi:hypothetical protein